MQYLRFQVTAEHQQQDTTSRPLMTVAVAVEHVFRANVVEAQLPRQVSWRQGDVLEEGEIAA